MEFETVPCTRNDVTAATTAYDGMIARLESVVRDLEVTADHSRGDYMRGLIDAIRIISAERDLRLSVRRYIK